MNNAENLTALQFKTAAIALSLMAVAEGGEVSEFAARKAGARLDALRALVTKGVLVRRYGPFVMPEGPYAGEEMISEAFYSAAE